MRRLRPSSGTAPSGVAIFGFRTGGVLVSEAGVPDSPLITSVPQPFRGILRVSTPSGGVSVVALRQRYNENGDYLITPTPPTLETGTPTAATRSFPHIVNGRGYTTQFILFSGTAGQTSGGNMRFYRQNGTPMPLSLR
jgi:hypothetical protein